MESHTKAMPVQLFITNKKVKMAKGQRSNEVWDNAHKEDLVDSVLNNYAIPELFVYRNEKGEDEVVDGQQRYTTLKRFFNNEFPIHLGEGRYKKAIYYSGSGTSTGLSEEEKFKFNSYNLSLRYISGTEYERGRQFKKLNKGIGMNCAEERNVDDSSMNDLIKRLVSYNYPIFKNLDKGNKRFFHNDMLSKLIVLLECKLRSSLSKKAQDSLTTRYGKEVPREFQVSIDNFVDSLNDSVFGSVSFNKQNILTLASVIIESENRGIHLPTKGLLERVLKTEKHIIKVIKDPEYIKNCQQGGYGKSVINMRAEKILASLSIFP